MQSPTYLHTQRSGRRSLRWSSPRRVPAFHVCVLSIVRAQIPTDSVTHPFSRRKDIINSFTLYAVRPYCQNLPTITGFLYIVQSTNPTTLPTQRKNYCSPSSVMGVKKVVIKPGNGTDFPKKHDEICVEYTGTKFSYISHFIGI